MLIEKTFEKAIDKLAEDFPNLNWNFELDDRTHELISRWLGERDEDVMVCAFKGKRIDEKFHRQDFFFFNFAIKNSYEALSNGRDSRITVNEGDCYIGQPFSGYALKGKRKDDMIILGILIRKEVFFREYFSTLAKGGSMFSFFLDAERREFSDSAIHFPLKKNSSVWKLLEVMAIEYAFKKEDCQKVLKPLALSLCMLLSRRLYEIEMDSNKNNNPATLAEQITQYINEGKATKLIEVAKHFGYHPNYISSLLHDETGKTFSEILLSSRMEKAKLLLTGSTLTIEEIAEILGYSGTSNFYKAYKGYFGERPRRWP